MQNSEMRDYGAKYGCGSPQIKWEDIKPALVRKVGSGGFAQVYEVYMYGALMAVKIVNLKADRDLNLSEALVRFKCTPDPARCHLLHIYIFWSKKQRCS